MASIQVKRGTRAQLEAAKPASGLAEGEPYLITDEGRLAVGTAANAYSDAALKSEVDAKLSLISGQSEINAALADDDMFAVYDTSVTEHRKSLMSRVWTYISSKLTGAISGVLTNNLTASRAVVSDGSGKVSASSVTSTELGYLSGVTSAVQTQINAKAPIIGPSFYGTVGQQGPFIFSKYGENSVIVARRANGTVENPTIALGDETLGQFAAYGYKGGGNWHYAGGIASVADADWETTSKASLRFYTGSGGASSHKMTLNTAGNLLIGTATDDASGAKLQVASSVNLAAGNAYKINNVQLVNARKTGWTAATGTATRTTFATSTVTTEQLAQRVKALLDDLLSHGLIGS